jgi:hypothetical protein
VSRGNISADIGERIMNVLDLDSEVFSRTLKLLGPPAPSCPKCQEALETVEVERYPDSIRWNKETGAYEFSKRFPAAVFFCPHCKQKIGEQFGDGKKWGFDPTRANVIGQVNLENEKQLLSKFGSRLSANRQERQEVSL